MKINAAQKAKNQNHPKNDIKWMSVALKLAQKAAQFDEVPVGAVLVAADGETILATAFNQKEGLHTPLGHAEILAIHRASKKLAAWRLVDSTLYVTLEPCLMCAGALLQARVRRLVYGAQDAKAGAVHSLFQTLTDTRLNHRLEVRSGVLANECGEILSNYFRKKRAQKKLLKPIVGRSKNE